MQILPRMPRIWPTVPEGLSFKCRAVLRFSELSGSKNVVFVHGVEKPCTKNRETNPRNAEN